MSLTNAKKYILYKTYLNHLKVKNNKDPYIQELTAHVKWLSNKLSPGNPNNAERIAMNIKAKKKEHKRMYDDLHVAILNNAEENVAAVRALIRPFTGSNNFRTIGNSIVKKRQNLLRHAARRVKKPTNAQVLKMGNRYGNYSLKNNSGMNVMNRMAKRRGYDLFNNLLRNIKKPVNSQAAQTIQRYFRGYRSRVTSKRIDFLKDLSREEGMEHYVNVIARLEFNYRKVLQSIALGGANAHTAITGIIGVCHYTPKPVKNIMNVNNVRKNLLLLKKKTPREYLQSFRKQFSYVALEYSKMATVQKKEYMKRLKEELSGRPCLENILDSLVHVLSKPEFRWLGKGRDPLNNNRYLSMSRHNGLMKEAISSWRSTTSRPNGWNNMNMNARKNYFWKKVKNNLVYMSNGQNIFNAPLHMYNRNGRKFKNSNVANLLEYV
jgi:hypothetical protein